MNHEPSKMINVAYNHLNLPRQITFRPKENIQYAYIATGAKLRKSVTIMKITTGSVTDYCGNFIYSDNQLITIFAGDVRIVPVNAGNSTFWKYEYSMKDHTSTHFDKAQCKSLSTGLGNVRVVFAAHSHGQPELLQQTSYYPFGMTMLQQNFGGQSATENKYLYNSKELQDDQLAGNTLDWYDYGARFYDATLGRWHVVDPLAEKHFETNTYHYCFNNPINFIDPLGLDTLNVCLPQDRTQQGRMTLIVNGQDVPLEGGDQVLGRGTTNSGKNPTRDPCETYGDTPSGEATVSIVLDRDQDGTFVNTDGSPVLVPEGEPNSQLIAQGRYFILLNPDKGDIETSNRTELGVHGGGTVLGENALQTQQRLVGTRGCLRVTNRTAAQIGAQAVNANDNHRVFRVIIEEE